jgi:hypothetical protein
MFVLCVVSKVKVQDSQDKEASTDEVQSTREKKESRQALGPTQPPINGYRCCMLMLGATF